MNGNPSNAMPVVGPDLLGRLLDQHGAALGLYARQLCDGPDDAVQEALIELVRQPVLPDDVVGWLYRVVRNKALSASRAAGRRRRRETVAAAQRAEWFTPSVEQAEQRLDAAEVAAAMEALTSEDREVVVTHIWGGLTFQQIGQLLGISDSSAHRRYVAALDTLRERFFRLCKKNS